MSGAARVGARAGESAFGHAAGPRAGERENVRSRRLFTRRSATVHGWRSNSESDSGANRSMTGSLRCTRRRFPTRCRPAAMTDSRRSLETLLAQGGHFIDSGTGAIVPPIHPSTTYARDERYELIGYGYSRSGNPTCEQVEAVLAELEGAEDALVFASGLAGVTTFFDTVRGRGAGGRPAGDVPRRRRLAAPARRAPSASRSRSSTRRRRRGWRPRSAPARPRWYGSSPRSIPPGT